jgi:hypothetical protein
MVVLGREGVLTSEGYPRRGVEEAISDETTSSRQVWDVIWVSAAD